MFGGILDRGSDKVIVARLEIMNCLDSCTCMIAPHWRILNERLLDCQKELAAPSENLQNHLNCWQDLIHMVMRIPRFYPRNFDFTIFHALNNYTWQWISQEQQLFPRKAVHSLKIDSTKTMDRIRQLCLVAHVDQVLSAIQMILKTLTWHSQFLLTIQQSLIQYSSVQCNWMSTTDTTTV